jgi:hypothetical protein
MRAFVREPRVTHQTKIAKSAMPIRARSLQSGAVDYILHLQRTIGNQTVQRLFQEQTANTEVDSTTTAGDAYEQEAGRVADQAMAISTYSAGSKASPRLGLQRLSGRSTRQIDTAPASVNQTLASVGRTLEAELRQDFEQRLGYDFSQVRVHSGAMAEQSARDVSANAYTVGHDIVFGAGQFAPQTLEGRRLIAHELTHVVQQSRSQSPIAASTRPGLVQRQKDPAARARVEGAMNRLKAKFRLAEVAEEHGATWSESELAKVDAAFSKVSKEDQPLLKDLHLIRTDRFDPFVRGGKTFNILGKTFDTGTIKLAAGAFRGDASTILHEVGHLIQNKVAEAMLEKSKAKSDLDAAAQMIKEERMIVPQGLGDFVDALKELKDAATGLLDSDENDREAKQNVLEGAIDQADMLRPSARKGDNAVATLLEYHDRLKKWAQGVEGYMQEKGTKNLAGFIDVVTKNNLARKGYAPFTDYVAANWPAKPQEFFAQSFYVWRTDPSYMKKHMRPLFYWFEKGGHREIKSMVEKTAPVIYELGKEAKETFWPKGIEEAIPLP